MILSSITRLIRASGRLRGAFAVTLFCLVSGQALADARMCTSADTLLFGNRDVGTSTVQHASVTNCGDAPFSFTGVFPHSANGPAWLVATTCATGQTLAAGASCSVDVTFAPTMTGQTSGGLWLHNTTVTPDQLLTFYGRGVTSAAGTSVLDFSPAQAQFGDTPVGQQAGPLQLLVRNVGAASVVPSALVINGPDAYEFSTLSSGDASDCEVGSAIAPGSSCRMNFFFRPQASGARRAQLVIDAPQLAGLVTVALGGNGATPVPTVDVVEFHDAQDGQYFLTADAAEIAFIDGGGLGAAWSRTGMRFAAWPRDEMRAPGALPVCRFFGVPGVGPNSHFYTADAAECALVTANPHWIAEGVAFRALLPTGGACPTGDTTIQRLWIAGADPTASRHRYVADASLIAPMLAADWVLEGPVFCAPG
jgi:hypothetical protein